VASLLGLPQEIAMVGCFLKWEYGRNSRRATHPRKVPEEAEEEEEEITDIRQRVGEGDVSLGMKLSSGRVVLVRARPTDAMDVARAKALVGRSAADSVVDAIVLDELAAKQLENKSEREVDAAFLTIVIPEVPSVLTEHTLQVALELCRQTEIDLEVRFRLAPNAWEMNRLRMAKEQVEERKKVLKALLKDEYKRTGKGYVGRLLGRKP
jgi:hypothetical protein